jgi:glycosyltransferase involved in cell wall biosynthesis
LLVSIITPSYNQAKYLEYTLQSVLAQKGEVELEYLVVDGGSKDGSLEVIHKYKAELDWWVSELDAGQAEAINKGFLHANGDLVTWINSDDLYLPGALAEAVSVMQSKPELGMVYGDAIAIDQKGEVLNSWRFGDWGLKELTCFRIICQPAVLIRKSVLESVGYLDDSYHYMLDHKLWLEIARIAPIQHIHSYWAAARSHAGAKNTANAKGFSRETMQLLEWMKFNPNFSEMVKNNHREIEGGAYRLSARYLLEGGLPGEALAAYALAVWYHPSYALKHWHRMIYALLYKVGARQLAVGYFALRSKHRKNLPDYERWAGWPGLSIHG